MKKMRDSLGVEMVMVGFICPLRGVRLFVTGDRRLCPRADRVE